MDSQYNVTEQINRYVYQVSRFLMVKNKEDIEKEIRSLIDDMLETKCQGREATQVELEEVFAELGKPMELAAKYNDSKRYLIGPALFPLYLRVLGYVTIVVVILSFVSMLVSAVKDGVVWNGFGGIFNAALSAFAMVTIIFGIIEWRGLSLESFGEADLKLPPVPKKNERISRAEPIAGIAFSVLFILLLVTIPECMGVWLNDQSRFLSIFDVDVIRSISGIIILSVCISIIKEVFRLVDGRYTIRVMISTIICGVLTFSLAVLVLKGFPIWNANFLTDLNASNIMEDTLHAPENWGMLASNILLALTAFGTVVEICKTIVGTIHYARSDES
jgi:hypothetical protein